MESLDRLWRRRKTNKRHSPVAHRTTFIGSMIHRAIIRVRRVSIFRPISDNLAKYTQGFWPCRAHIVKSTVRPRLTRYQQTKRKRGTRKLYRTPRVCLRFDLTSKATMLLSLPKGDRGFHLSVLSGTMRFPCSFSLRPRFMSLFSLPPVQIVNYNRENTAFRNIKRTGSRFK